MRTNGIFQQNEDPTCTGNDAGKKIATSQKLLHVCPMDRYNIFPDSLKRNGNVSNGVFVVGEGNHTGTSMKKYAICIEYTSS